MSNEESFGEEDLYGDLNDIKTAKAKPSKSPPTAPTGASEGEKQPAPGQLDKLIAENSQLKRNIGILYRTAKTEIKRKDDEITRLMDRIEELERSPRASQGR